VVSPQPLTGFEETAPEFSGESQETTEWQSPSKANYGTREDDLSGIRSSVCRGGFLRIRLGVLLHLGDLILDFLHRLVHVFSEHA
jgi:hypothetical protein